MLKITPWIERKFNFDYPAEYFPGFYERLIGTLPRIKALTNELSAETLESKIDGKWSIKEHIGHLGDVHLLFDYRFQQYMNGDSELMVPEMKGKVTNEADHNAKSLSEVIDYFISKRMPFIEQLDQLSADDLARSAHHPRLDKPMRLVDMLFFMSEHDDFHLSWMRYLSRL